MSSIFLSTCISHCYKYAYVNFPIYHRPLVRVQIRSELPHRISEAEHQAPTWAPRVPASELLCRSLDLISTPRVRLSSFIANRLVILNFFLSLNPHRMATWCSYISVNGTWSHLCTFGDNVGASIEPVGQNAGPLFQPQNLCIVGLSIRYRICSWASLLARINGGILLSLP